MAKMKTRKSAVKRFRINSNGTIKYAHSNKNHKLGKKAQSRKRALRKTAYVSKADAANVKALIK